MPTIDNWRALREALDAGPTDGPMYVPKPSVDLYAVRVKSENGIGKIFADVGFSGSELQDSINAEYIAAAHPAAIRSLLDERDRLAAEVEALRADAGRFPAMSGKYADVLGPFLRMMEAELHANASKGDRPGWLSMSPSTALLEIYWHTAKLSAAVKNNDAALIREHSADVANMAMMLLDVCGGLDVQMGGNHEA